MFELFEIFELKMVDFHTLVKKKTKPYVNDQFVLGLMILLKFLELQCVYSEAHCPQDNYIIVDSRGLKQDCFPCHNCYEGSGLMPRCGSKMTESQKRTIKCKPCIPGQTFSDEYGPSFCKPCDICHPKQNVIMNCTISHNSKCSKSCKEGYYFDDITTHECQECSYCCNDTSKDYIIDECRDMPKLKQCSIQSDCSLTVATTKALIATSFMLTTVKSKEYITRTIKIIIAGSTFGSLLVIVLIIYCIWRYRRTIETSADVERQPLHCLTCSNLEKSCLILQLDVEPACEVQEGQDITITCSVLEKQCKLNNLEQFEIKWTKDGMYLMEFQNSLTLRKQKTDIFDIGSYTCQVKCKDHAESSEGKCEKEVQIDVRPGEGKHYQKMRHLIGRKIDEEEFTLRIVPFWKKVAKKCGMEDYKIKALETGDPNQAARETSNYLCSSTETTVYELLKFSKENNLKDFVEFLSQDASFIFAESTKDKQDEKKTTQKDSRKNENSDLDITTSTTKRPSFNRLASYESSI